MSIGSLTPPEGLTIVMYHYVRDLARSTHPRINGLTIEQFQGQVSFLAQHYDFVTMQQVVSAVTRGTDLPPHSVLLTFDDGYADHHDVVFPILEGMGVQGSFFPAASAVAEQRVLDVNKIHFVLAAVEDAGRVAQQLCADIETNRKAFDLHPSAYYVEVYSSDHRYDNPAITFIKRVLQRGLPEELRARLIDGLFREHVTQDEASFAAELYLSRDQIRAMAEGGMYFGSHGWAHAWMNDLDECAQQEDVDHSLAFLQSLDIDTRDWVMCYPYGAYDDRLLALLRARGCRLGLTADVGVSRPGTGDPLLLPRLDTCDLPMTADAKVIVDTGLPLGRGAQ